MDSKRLVGIALIIAGVVMLALGSRAMGAGQVHWLAMLGATVVVAGTIVAFRRASPKITQGHAAVHVPGFSPTHAAKHIAIEGKTGRLWVRDNQLGERIIDADELAEWRVHRDDTKFGVEVRTNGAEPTVWFARTGEARESAEEWITKIGANRRELGK